MKFLYSYLTFAISIGFISWIVGMFLTLILNKLPVFKNSLTRLSFIKSEKVNKYIGVGLIKWITKNTFFKFFNPKLKIKGKATTNDLILIRKEMTKSEIDHLLAFLFVLIFVVLKYSSRNMGLLLLF